MDKVHVAVVGATGAVGSRLMQLLGERQFPIGNIDLFASDASEGKKLMTPWGEKTCQRLKEGCFKGVQLAFFDASDQVSQGWVPHALASHAFVVDNSACFRYDKEIPLLVPEVNPQALEESLKRQKRLIAGPNCSTVQLVLVLHPIQRALGLKRVIVSTYQSVSGAGSKALEELEQHTAHYVTQKRRLKAEHFLHSIVFNCIPQIGSCDETGYTSEEIKLMRETKKILQLPDLLISATAVRVPTQFCHAESVTFECEKDFSVENIRSLLSEQPGLCVSSDVHFYPMGISQDPHYPEAMGQDAVSVGRIRKDPQLEKTGHLWIVSDNLRKGAALNAIQIGECLLPYL